MTDNRARATGTHGNYCGAVDDNRRRLDLQLATKSDARLISGRFDIDGQVILRLGVKA